MQDQGRIARTFADWQRAYQKFVDAEARLAAATAAWKQGLQARPDALRDEVTNLKAEQDSRYDLASDSLRKHKDPGAGPVACAVARPGGPSAQPA
jgi:hypothetical protein